MYAKKTNESGLACGIIVGFEHKRMRGDNCPKNCYFPSHLSKWPSDLKINGTQENITFSDPAFHGLPCGVLLFASSVSFKNHETEATDWLLKNSSHSEGGF